MTYGEQILKSLAEQIEVKYLQAVRRGWHDSAVIIDMTMKYQEPLRQRIAQQRGVSSSEVPAAGLVLSGDRTELARQLSQRFPGNQAADTLANESPPEGNFPVLILTDADQPPGKVGIHFFYRPKPEIPAAPPDAAILCEGRVSKVIQYLQPPQRVEFQVHGVNAVLVAGQPFLLSLSPGDRVFAAYQFDASGKAIVLDMLHCGPDGMISQQQKEAFRTRLGEILWPPDVEG